MIDNDLMQEIITTAPPFLLALTCHEVAHGYVAYLFGDPTAKEQGRLTLNPLKHLDPLGVLAFFIMKIGWARPVPVNPAYFKNPRRDMALVALAGPGMNIALALVSSILGRIFLLFAPVFPSAIMQPLGLMIGASIWINIVLAVFNLLPIPPLDGSRLLTSLLPPELAASYARLERFGFLLLLALFYLGVIPKMISPIISYGLRLLS